jgi:hypothetical protein
MNVNNESLGDDLVDVARVSYPPQWRRKGVHVLDRMNDKQFPRKG